MSKSKSDKVTVDVLLYSKLCKVCNSPYRLIYESMAENGIPNSKITELAQNNFDDISFSAMSLGRHLKKHAKIEKKVYFKELKDTDEILYNDVMLTLRPLSKTSLTKEQAHRLVEVAERDDIDNQQWTKTSLLEKMCSLLKEIGATENDIEVFRTEFNKEIERLKAKERY